MEKLKTILNPISILDTSSHEKTLKERLTQYNKSVMSPIRFEVKKFYPMSSKQNIFEGCKLILEREKQGLFEYEIDGLIFTPTLLGVGGNKILEAGPKKKMP